MAPSHTPPAFAGVYSLLLTPFGHDGGVAWDTYRRYLDWQLGHDPQGLFAVCGSSEMKWLTRDERLRLAALAVEHAEGRLPVVATANLEPSPVQHGEEIERMAATGVAGVVLVPPPQLSHDPLWLRDYLLAMAELSPCPLLFYEWPQVPNSHLSAEVFDHLAARGAVAGIKDTTCTTDGIAAKIAGAGGATVFQANTPLLPDTLDMGANGVMAVTSTAVADMVCRLWHRRRQGLPTDRLHRELVFLDALLRSDYPATAKHLVGLRGLDFPTACRWPTRLRQETAKAVEVWFHGLDRDLLDGDPAPDLERVP